MTVSNEVAYVDTSLNILVDTGRKLNVHKTLRRRPGCLLNVLSIIFLVLCTFNLRPVSTGMLGKSKVFCLTLGRFLILMSKP